MQRIAKRSSAQTAHVFAWLHTVALLDAYQGGWYSLIGLHGSGSPAAMKQEIWRRCPVGDKVARVERLLERGAPADAERPITRNRQPGRCCDRGCNGPGQAVMVELPEPRRG